MRPIELRWGIGSLHSAQEGSEQILPSDWEWVHATQEVDPLVQSSSVEQRGSRFSLQNLGSERIHPTEYPERGGGSHTFVTQLKHLRETRTQNWQPPCNSQGSGWVFSPFARLVLYESRK